jgi:hypothetical protein
METVFDRNVKSYRTQLKPCSVNFGEEYLILVGIERDWRFSEISFKFRNVLLRNSLSGICPLKRSILLEHTSLDEEAEWARP